MGDMYNNNSIFYKAFPDLPCNYQKCRQNCKFFGSSIDVNNNLCLSCQKLYGVSNTPCIKRINNEQI